MDQGGLKVDQDKTRRALSFGHLSSSISSSHYGENLSLMIYLLIISIISLRIHSNTDSNGNKLGFRIDSGQLCEFNILLLNIECSN